MRRLIAGVLVLLLGSSAAWSGGLFGPHGAFSANSQMISAVSLNNTSFTQGAASGTVVGAIITTMSPPVPAFSGSYALTGPDAASFAVVGGNVVTQGVLTGAGPYSIKIVATSSAGNVPNSPFTSQTIQITGVPAGGAQTISSVTVNTPQFVAGSGSAGRTVSTISTIMSPASPAFTGTYTVGGTDASKFAISGGNLIVGAADVNPGQYSVTITATPAGSQTIYLLPSNTSPWTVPADWNNSNNSIEVIGGGGGGRNGYSGGGGGAYSKIANQTFTPGATINFAVGSGGAGAAASVTGADGATGGDTWFGGTNFATSLVAAKGGGGGTSAAAGVGGDAASGIGTVKHSGGAGGGPTIGNGWNSGGGGGAGGPNGDGAAGGTGSGNGNAGGGSGGGGAGGGGAGAGAADNPGANGGAGFDATAGGVGAAGIGSVGANGSHGSGGGGGYGDNAGQATSGGTGGNGLEWDASHGAGGGGGGGGTGTASQIVGNPSPSGGNGGLYGGGGAGGGFGASSNPRGKGGDGANGIIVIKYSPTGAIAPFTTSAITITGTAPPQTISSVNLSNTSFVQGSASGTVVGQLSAAMNPALPNFSGTFSLGGNDAAAFAISGTALVTNGVQSGASYSIAITATPADGSIGPKTQAFTITGTAGTPVQTIAGISLSGTQFNAGTGSANAVIGTVTVTMNPPSPPFDGIVTQNNSSFRLSGEPTAISLNPSSVTIPQTAASGTALASANVTMSDGSAFTGSLVASNPSLVSSSGLNLSTARGLSSSDVGTQTIQIIPVQPVNLSVGPADLQAGVYSTTLTATPTNGAIAPLSQAKTITGNGQAGAVVTTFTFANNTGSTLPSGTPVRFGQAFRRGDVPATNCVMPRNASTHANLAYDLFEVATRRENNDDGSLRHLAWWIRTDAAVPNNGTYTVEWAKTGVSCPAQTPRTAAAMKARLVAASHALKIVFTDVRNQDGSLRGVSGHNTLTFDVNSAFDNTGRDAPRSCGAGDVADCWILSGAPKNDQGVADPMLYVNFYLTATSNADGTLGPLVHSAIVGSPWMNVAAGSAGNSGAPGPVGLSDSTGGGNPSSGHGDPQAISYRPQLLDGATNQLDWSWLDQSVASTSNPVTTGTNTGGCPGGNFLGNGDWNFPNSLAKNAIPFNTLYLYHTAGTPPAGMTNNSLIFAYPVGLTNGGGSNPSLLTKVHFMNSPFECTGSTTSIDPSNQGSGTQLFDFRVWHTHNTAWMTVDQNAAANVTAADGTRTAWNIYPALTATEQNYWRQTGTIVPSRNTSGLSDANEAAQDRTMNVYSPNGPGNMHYGSGGGNHNDLAQVNEYASQGFVGETKALWDNALIAEASYFAEPYTHTLNERTGRIPVMNNGPPGANHGGAGGSYPTLGAPFGALGTGAWLARCDLLVGLAPALNNTPLPLDCSSNGGWGYPGGGLSRWGADNSHFGSYSNGVYQFWGRPQDLEIIYQEANHAHMVASSTTNAPSHTRFTMAGVTYYGLLNYGIQSRDGINGYRDNSMGVAFGDDSNPERAYFQDMATEIYWAQQAYDIYFDGSSTNYRSLFTSPWKYDFTDPFQDAYGGQMAYQSWGMQRDPLGKYFLDHYNAIYGDACGPTPQSGMSPYYCSNFTNTGNILNSPGMFASGPIYSANIGQFLVPNGSARAIDAQYWDFPNDGTGTVTIAAEVPYYLMRNGDLVRIGNDGGNPSNPDQLVGGTSYAITSVNNSGSNGSTISLKIINPATGTPFTSWTFHGSPYTGSIRGLLEVKPSGSGPGWAGTYPKYVQTILIALRAMGYSGGVTALNTMMPRSVADGWPTGFVDPGSGETRLNWDPNITVP